MRNRAPVAGASRRLRFAAQRPLQYLSIDGGPLPASQVLRDGTLDIPGLDHAPRKPSSARVTVRELSNGTMALWYKGPSLLCPLSGGARRLGPSFSTLPLP